MALPVSLPQLPPIWREGRLPLEAAALVRDPVWRGEGVARGAGRPVLLIPGFLAGDASLAPMSFWLRELGYRTERTGIRVNVDCSALACGRMEERLEALAEQTGERVALVGQSRGGVMARALAVQRPDLVSGVVTLGAPLRSQLGSLHPVVLAQVGIVAVLGAAGRPGLFTPRCLLGECCRGFRQALREPFPAKVGLSCVYSRSDGIVGWRACLDPEADEHVEVDGSHCGMSVSAAAYRAVGEALERFAATGWARAA